MQNTKIKLVQAIYEANPNIEDDEVQAVVNHVFNDWPSDKTLSVWKARLRKKGVQIPDKRLKNSKR